MLKFLEYKRYDYGFERDAPKLLQQITQFAREQDKDDLIPAQFTRTWSLGEWIVRLEDKAEIYDWTYGMLQHALVNITDFWKAFPSEGFECEIISEEDYAERGLFYIGDILPYSLSSSPNSTVR